jgi:restriction system protein
MPPHQPHGGQLKPLQIKLVHAAFQSLKENDGELKKRDLFAKVESRLDLTEWEKERFEATGNVRWESILHFVSIAAVKAGFLVKKKGVWFLTPEGEGVCKLNGEGLFEACKQGYKKWKLAQKDSDENSAEAPSPDEEELIAQIGLEKIEEQARAGFENYINSLNPYEFQDLCAALLRAMGYHTPFVAPKGPDGGIDIIAYLDPLGVTSPRIGVQVKHKQSSVQPGEIQSLVGALGMNSKVGIFFSSGGFTKPAIQEARKSSTHIELIDLERFIDLWQEFYPEMSDDEKDHLPLKVVYFLSPEAVS